MVRSLIRQHICMQISRKNKNKIRVAKFKPENSQQYLYAGGGMGEPGFPIKYKN